MKNFHPFFIIGTGGTIVTAMLHMFLALALSIAGVHSIFVVLYPTFVSFLMIGAGLMLKKQNEVVIKD